MELGDLLLELLAVPSVTGEEGPLADWLAERYDRRRLPFRRLGDSLVVGDFDPHRPNVALVGHIDTVPPTSEDGRPRREGDRIFGRGASDMKAGLAVAMACFEDDDLRTAGARNPVLVAYAGEEGSFEGNELGRVLDEVAALRHADLAVVCEPTDLAVQLGCMGNLNAEVTFTGRAAHSARPWQGDNALVKAGGLLVELAGLAPVDVTVQGLVFRDVITATQARTTNARNVVPDRFVVNCNYRFAPDKDTATAAARLHDLVAGRADITIVDAAEAAAPFRDEPLVEAFVAAAGGDVGPKQAWTDVARFAAAGVPALNYGPGLTSQAHQAGEYVPEDTLHAAARAVAAFLRG